MRRQSELLASQRVDWTIVIVYLIMVLFGMVNIYSSSYNPDFPSPFDFSMPYGKQFGWAMLSFLTAGVIMLIDGNFIKKQAFVSYGIVLFMLIAVLFFPPIKGARSWFGWGSVGVQPSEFAKITTSLALATYLSSINIKTSNFKNRLTILALIGVPAMLVLLQPDPGTLLVYISFILVMYREGLSGNILLFVLFSVVLAVLTVLFRTANVDVFGSEIPALFFISGVLILVGALAFTAIRLFVYRRDRKKYVLRLLLALGIANGFMFFTDYSYDHILKDRHRNRIELFLGLDEDPDGKDYNRNRAMAAVGSGGFAGKGYLNATLANARFKHVPEQNTDFAYCTLNEELGFVGGVSVVLLFMTLLFRIIVVAERQRSSFTRIYAYSVAGILFFHFMINIGMTIGLAPVIGIPLPFFSYGGSSLFSFTILIFILVRLDSERMDVLR